MSTLWGTLQFDRGVLDAVYQHHSFMRGIMTFSRPWTLTHWFSFMLIRRRLRSTKKIPCPWYRSSQLSTKASRDTPQSSSKSCNSPRLLGCAWQSKHIKPVFGAQCGPLFAMAASRSITCRSVSFIIIELSIVEVKSDSEKAIICFLKVTLNLYQRT